MTLSHFLAIDPTTFPVDHSPTLPHAVQLPDFSSAGFDRCGGNVHGVWKHDQHGAG